MPFFLPGVSTGVDRGHRGIHNEDGSVCAVRTTAFLNRPFSQESRGCARNDHAGAEDQRATNVKRNNSAEAG